MRLSRTFYNFFHSQMIHLHIHFRGEFDYSELILCPLQNKLLCSLPLNIAFVHPTTFQPSNFRVDFTVSTSTLYPLLIRPNNYVSDNGSEKIR